MTAEELMKLLKVAETSSLVLASLMTELANKAAKGDQHSVGAVFDVMVNSNRANAFFLQQAREKVAEQAGVEPEKSADVIPINKEID